MTEEEILINFKANIEKVKAFSALMDLYKRRLYWHIRRMVIDHEDTNDVLQNVFIKVWKNLDNFRGEAGLYTWLYRIASNETFTFLKREKKRKTLSLSDDEFDLSNSIKADRHFNPAKIEWKMQLAIQKLPTKQKEVFSLRYYDEMPYAEIAKLLDTSEGALKASYHHAIKKIQEYLTGD